MKKKTAIIKYHSRLDKITKCDKYEYDTILVNTLPKAEEECLFSSKEGDTVYSYKVTFELVKTGKVKTIVE